MNKSNVIMLAMLLSIPFIQVKVLAQTVIMGGAI